MKLVTLTRDIHPWRANGSYAVPDAMAKSLIDAGDATVNPDSPFPADVPPGGKGQCTRTRTAYLGPAGPARLMPLSRRNIERRRAEAAVNREQFDIQVAAAAADAIDAMEAAHG